jgi:hypothetical protein
MTQMKTPKMVVETMAALYFHWPPRMITILVALNVQIRNVIETKN